MSPPLEETSETTSSSDHPPIPNPLQPSVAAEEAARPVGRSGTHLPAFDENVHAIGFNGWTITIYHLFCGNFCGDLGEFVERSPASPASSPTFGVQMSCWNPVARHDALGQGWDVEPAVPPSKYMMDPPGYKASRQACL